MENNGKVISIGQGAANLNRSFWSFNYPHQVVSDAKLDPEEKRAILSAWASDEHAVESLPTLRHLPGTPFPVTFTSIMAAMVALDKITGADCGDPSLPPAPVNAGLLANSAGMGNGLIMALDRRGRLQTARWSDARPKSGARAMV